MNALNIKFVGFSVTGYGNPSYPDLVNTKMAVINPLVNVTAASVGGLSIDGLPFLMKMIVRKEDSINLVFLEIATSWYSLVRNDLAEAVSYIQMIVNYLESIGARVVFLNLYRKDVDDQDVVVRAIESVSDGRYPILNLKNIFRERFVNEGDDGTTDGVHPIDSSIDLIANKIVDFLVGLKPSNSRIGLIVESVEPELIFINSQSVYAFDNRRGVVLNSAIIKPGECLNLNFDTPKLITGIFYLFGPDTSSVKLEIGGDMVDVPAHDTMSFYRRIGYRYLGKRKVSSLKLNCPLDKLEVILQREPWEKVNSVQNYIIGFSSLLYKADE